MPGKVQLLTQIEYAQRRGVSGAAVCKAVKEGRISLIGGKIDPAVADIQWAQNSQPRANRRKLAQADAAEAAQAAAAAQAAPPAAEAENRAAQAAPGAADALANALQPENADLRAENGSAEPPKSAPDAPNAPEAKKSVRSAAKNAPQAAAPLFQSLSGSDDGDYWAARARREVAEAAISEMKRAELEGKLIRTDAVRAAWAKRLSSTRDALLQIPHRLAPVLAAESDSERVSRLLEDELRQVLEDLARPDKATQGAAT